MKRRGFTLVELLAVMGLMVIILTLLGMLYQQFFKVVETVTETTGAYDEIRSVNQMFTREMGSTLCRNNPNRWLNFRVKEDQKGIYIYFTAPDEALDSTLDMSFISHYAWYYRKADRAVYRAIYNTRLYPDDLLSTAASSDNDNSQANRNRLKDMTLAYQHNAPYGWTEDPRFTRLLDQPGYKALLNKVYRFEVRCYDRPAGSPNARPKNTWDDHASLPVYVELVVGVAKGGVARRAEQELASHGKLTETAKQLNTFVLSIPMINHGVYDNAQY
jgi:prepilin-type N-terminal cleavage/methylation domain-containing protein